MGTSLGDVTMTLKQQEKIENIFFLNKIHFYKVMYVGHFYPKIHTGLHSGLHYIIDVSVLLHL